MLPVLLIALGGSLWSSDGHRLVCEIAWLELTPGVRHQVETLVAHDTAAAAMEQWCVWADDVKRLEGYRHFTTAHYVNLPLGAAGFVLERDCGDSYCAVEAIRDVSATLRDRSASTAHRLEALKFLGHLVGDIHQPLHAAYAHDRGGNDVHVMLGGEETNLHRVWDTQLLMQLGVSVRDSERLYKAIQPIDRVLWADLSPVTWVHESYQLTVHQVYSGIENNSITNNYVALNRYTVERQIMKAGFRLGALLNVLLGD